jgi:hypothetical protein
VGLVPASRIMTMVCSGLLQPPVPAAVEPMPHHPAGGGLDRATPASMANAASERSQPGCDQLISSRAAVTGPTPGWASGAGASARTSLSSCLAFMCAGVQLGRQRQLPGEL